MFQNLRISHSILRISLTLVFLWFGIDKFINPQYWLNAWVPPAIISLANTFHIASTQLVYANGVFEVLVGISLLTDVFVEIFSFLALLFLVTVSLFHGINEVLVRDVGIAGGFLALIFWPRPRRIF